LPGRKVFQLPPPAVDALTARFIRAMDEDAAALGVEKPDHEPRATQYVPQMLDLIGRLQEKKLAPATFAKAVWTFETLVFPYIGSRPIAKLTPVDVLKVLRRIEGRGIHETAHRTRQRCAQVFRYAVQTERAERDVTADLRGALAPVVSEHHAAITDPAAGRRRSPRRGPHRPMTRRSVRNFRQHELCSTPMALALAPGGAARA